MGETASNRRIVALTGKDALPFLQGIVSNDVLPLARAPGLVWTALLTPQGKYLADFFVAHTDALYLDLPESLADATLRRLSLYRLRADVQLVPTTLHVTRSLESTPDSLPDPRHPALGWRSYGPPGTAPQIDWDAIRVAHVIPETGIELIPDDSYLLETAFDRLHGVDFRKGCYVGQEVTARMKHKTDLRKGLRQVIVDGAAPVGTPIMAGDKEAGTLYTQSKGRGIAYLRFDRVTDAMTAGTAIVRQTEAS